MIKVSVAGCTGWTGAAVTKGVLRAPDLKLVSAVARSAAGQDVGAALALPVAGVTVTASLDEALSASPDVLVDYIGAAGVKARVLAALERKIRVVVGSSGLSADDYAEIAAASAKHATPVFSAGNYSITAALAKRCALMAAEHVPSWEIIDYAEASKPDAPSGTTRELAEALAAKAQNQMEVPVDNTLGRKEARGAAVGGAQLHSLRLPGYKFSFETIFGLPGERLSIRHDALESAEPYVSGTLLAVRKVMGMTGLVRGMDSILFAA